MRGGTQDEKKLRGEHGGLSPLARGNLGEVGWPHPIVGSIPACAGEPLSVSYS